jgi:hypothetical protein
MTIMQRNGYTGIYHLDPANGGTRVLIKTVYWSRYQDQGVVYIL